MRDRTHNRIRAVTIDGKKVLIEVPNGWHEPRLWTKIRYRYYDLRRQLKAWAFDRRVARINRRKSKLPIPVLNSIGDGHVGKSKEREKLVSYAEKVSYRRKPRQ